ncbi:MAG: myo-inosose-2 dehydratase, partial [Betaproteobacteria bacterium AqS2]|nr:myo-inosose-2 dehydratase [Betaproteobacteria bacterium AqS2]
MSAAPGAVRLAVAPIAWRNDDIEEISELYSVADCLRESVEAGYVGTEAGRSYPRDPAQLKELLDAAGIVMASGWWSGMLRTGTVEDEIARIDAELRLYEGVGADIMFYGEIDGSVQAASEPLSRRP